MFQPIRTYHVIVSTYSTSVPWSRDELRLSIHIMWSIPQSRDIQGRKLKTIKYSVRDRHASWHVHKSPTKVEGSGTCSQPRSASHLRGCGGGECWWALSLNSCLLVLQRPLAISISGVYLLYDTCVVVVRHVCLCVYACGCVYVLRTLLYQVLCVSAFLL